MSRMPRKFKPNRQKMRQLILYISQNCARQSSYGKTKLFKTLYFADSLSFLHSGEPITGWRYVRLPYGPFPDVIDAELQAMIESKLLQMQIVGGDYLYPLQKPVNLKEPDLSEFSPQEIVIVNHVIQELENLSGTYLSESTHRGAWKFVSQGEEIPYESFHLDTHPLTEPEIIRGMEVAGEHGFLA
ncbi:MAG: Panacea domain-containing protein [Chloroflexota bacterium]|nr:Panacea domain-containing protein [Chloroflexota bacterium]